MQTNTGKYTIIALLLLIIPMVASAQIGNRKYVTRSGDTTTVVMAALGLKGEASAFLLDKKIFDDYDDKFSRYKNIRDAAQETQSISDLVSEQRENANPTSGSLSFRIAKENIASNSRQREAERQVRKNTLNKDASVDEMLFLIEKFGDKPSYFVNGVQVDEKIASSISSNEKLSREFKVTNTITGNPNGEVWFTVNERTLAKLNIETPVDRVYAAKPSPDSQARGEYFQSESTQKEAAYANFSTAQREKLTTQQQEVEELKAQINAIRIQKGLEPLPDTQKQVATPEVVKETAVAVQPQEITDEKVVQPVPQLTEQQKQAERLRAQINELRVQRGLEPLPSSSILPDTPGQETPITSATKTEKVVVSQPQTTQPSKVTTPRKVKEEVVSFRDSPLEKAKHADNTETIVATSSETEIVTDPKITEDTPKRSVRRIKDRERLKK